jgi:hypothetical protein
LADKLLSDCAAEREELDAKRLKDAKSVTLVCDGWQNTRRERVLGFVALTPLPVLVRAVVMQAERQTSEYVAGEIESAMHMVGDGKAASLVTDSCSVMCRARDLVRAAHSEMTVYGCSRTSCTIFVRMSRIQANP